MAYLEENINKYKYKKIYIWDKLALANQCFQSQMQKLQEEMRYPLEMIAKIVLKKIIYK